MARRGSLHQDYYQTLGLEAGASEEEIRKAYRRLAFEFHPDRNPGDKGAEERFKQISEAYACLADKANRERYDRARSGGFDPYRYQGGPFSNGQGEGFRDFFSGSQGKDIFSELREEFAAFGLRFDEEFLRRVFFQGQSSYFRRIQFGFPGGFGTYRAYYRNTSPSGRYSDLVGPRISSLLMQSVLGSLSSLGMSRLQERWMGLRDAVRAFWNGLKAPSPDQVGSDLHHDLEISLQEAVTGCQRVFSFDRQGREERILLKIPPGVKSGTRLRIVGRGLVVKDGSPGSLYIRLKILSEQDPRSSAAGSFHAR